MRGGRHVVALLRTTGRQSTIYDRRWYDGQEIEKHKKDKAGSQENQQARRLV